MNWSPRLLVPLCEHVAVTDLDTLDASRSDPTTADFSMKTERALAHATFQCSNLLHVTRVIEELLNCFWSYRYSMIHVYSDPKDARCGGDRDERTESVS